MNCDACNRVALASEGKDAKLITEFPNSFLFLGDHQYFEGYCVLIAKSHVREMHEMSDSAASALTEELMQASRAIQAAFDPWKLNHASLGNIVQHLHWHIFPRYENDDDRFRHPWYREEQFKTRVPDAATQAKLIKRIKNHLGHSA